MLKIKQISKIGCIRFKLNKGFALRCMIFLYNYVTGTINFKKEKEWAPTKMLSFVKFKLKI